MNYLKKFLGAAVMLGVVVVVFSQPATVPRPGGGGVTAAQVTNIVLSLTSTGGISTLQATQAAQAVVLNSNGNWIATSAGIGVNTRLHTPFASNTLSLTGLATTVAIDVRGTDGGAYRQRFNFGSDMGQTYSWQQNTDTNRWCIQRQNTDADMPLMITRTGAKIGSLNATVTNLGSFLVSGVVSLNPTNSAAFSLGSANSNAATVTNFLGVIHMVAAATMFHNAAVAGEWSVTNRISAATTIVLTNTAAGKSLFGTVIGEASGGTSRQVTIQPDTGHLVASLDDYSASLATSLSFTLTNGNAVEWSDEVRRLNGTNVHKIVTRQFKF